MPARPPDVGDDTSGGRGRAGDRDSSAEVRSGAMLRAGGRMGNGLRLTGLRGDVSGDHKCERNFGGRKGNRNRPI